MDDERRLRMNDNEKITINLGPVDLGRIDVLVEQGLYSNRSDAIRTAVRNLLDRHEEVINVVRDRTSAAIGALILGKSDLEKKKKSGQKYRLNIIGMLVLKNDITPELATEVIDSVSVHGVFRAPEAVKKALMG